MYFGKGIQVNLTVYPCKPPHILVFEVAAIGPSDHLNSYLISSGFYPFRNIKFTGRHAAFVETGIFTIDPHPISRFHPIKMKDDLLTGPIFRNIKFPDIKTRWVEIYRDHWRIIRGKFHRDIPVDVITISLHLPGTGDPDLSPVRCIKFFQVKIIGCIQGSFGPLKFPGSVQGLIKR